MKAKNRRHGRVPAREPRGASAYHGAVRTWLMALMIVLLPLRGWVGDAMAFSMAMGPAGHGATVTATAPMPCHASPAAALDATAHDGLAHDVAHDSTHSHLLCDLCNGPALDAPWPWSLVPRDLPASLPPCHERFASQTARRDVRPPIS